MVNSSLLLELSGSVFLTQHFDLQLVESCGTHRNGFTCIISSAIWEELVQFNFYWLSLSLLAAPFLQYESFSSILIQSLHNNLFWLLHVFSSASCIYFVYIHRLTFENVKYINFKHPIEELNICRLFIQVTTTDVDNQRGCLAHKRIYSSEVKILRKLVRNWIWWHWIFACLQISPLSKLGASAVEYHFQWSPTSF